MSNVLVLESACKTLHRRTFCAILVLAFFGNQSAGAAQREIVWRKMCRAQAFPLLLGFPAEHRVSSFSETHHASARCTGNPLYEQMVHLMCTATHLMVSASGMKGSSSSSSGPGRAVALGCCRPRLPVPFDADFGRGGGGSISWSSSSLLWICSANAAIFSICLCEDCHQQCS